MFRCGGNVEIVLHNPAYADEVIDIGILAVPNGVRQDLELRHESLRYDFPDPGVGLPASMAVRQTRFATQISRKQLLQNATQYNPGFLTYGVRLRLLDTIWGARLGGLGVPESASREPTKTLQSQVRIRFAPLQTAVAKLSYRRVIEKAEVNWPRLFSL